MRPVQERSEREEAARRRGTLDGLLVGATATLLLFSAFFFSSGESTTGFLFLGLGAMLGATLFNAVQLALPC